MDMFLVVLGDSLLATITSPIFLCVIIFALIVIGVLFYFDKKKKMMDSTNSFDFGLSKSNDEHLKELEEIKKLMSIGSNKPIEVDAINALYIARHFDQYNLLASEKGTVVFERLLQVGDTIEATIENKSPLIKEEIKQNNIQSMEVLPNGDVRLMREGGYTVFRDGLIVGSKIFEENNEQKKKQTQPLNEQHTATKESKKKEVMKVANAFREDIIVVPTQNSSLGEISSIPTPLSTDTIQKDETFSNEINEVRTINSDETILVQPDEVCTDEHVKQEENSSWVDQVVNRAKGEDKFNSDEEIINADGLAALVSGKTIKQKPTKKEIKDFSPLYLFENNEDFFRIAFLSEPEEKSFDKKIIKFLSFVIQHEIVFLTEGDNKIYVHVDSLILAFARTITKESRNVFLKGLYDESGSLSNKSLSAFMHLFSKKIELIYEKTFVMWWKPQQLDYRSCIFPRAIKYQSKIFKGEFVVLNFKESVFSKIISNLDVLEIGNAIIIGSSSAELEALNGKKQKIRNLQEMTDVL